MNNIIIVGDGLSGYLLAYNLVKKNMNNILLIGKNSVSNSSISGGEILTRGFEGKSIKRNLLENGEFINDNYFLDLYLNNIDKNITEFSNDFLIKPSFIGGQISIGKVILDIKKFLENKINFINGEVSNVNIIENKFSGVEIFNGVDSKYVSGKTLIVCSGGYGNIFSKNDNIDNNLFNMHGILLEKGVCMRNLELLMFHPFGKQVNNNLLKYNCIKTDTLSGKNVKDVNGDDIPEIKYILDSHNAHHNFSNILKIFYEKKQIFIDSNEVFPLVHYTLGGINIDKNFMTNIKGIFSYGEASIGISGMSRIGGASFSEIITFSPIICDKIIKFLNNNSFKNFSRKCSYNHNIDLIKETKNELSKFLSFDILYGSNEYKLKEIYKYIFNLNNCSYKTIALGIIVSMLSRKESRGMFFRTDYNKKSIFPKNVLYDNKKIKLKYTNICIYLRYIIYKLFFQF